MANSYENQKKSVKQFGQTFEGAYPEEMRRQLWPLCCGASILSGFKRVMNMSQAELVKAINSTITDYVPDLQVYAEEQICPRVTFLTLNSGQMSSKTVMSAIEEAGFKLVGTASPRGGEQGFFIRDDSKTWKAAS